MTTFKAPPNQSDLVLQNGDILLVEAMGTATNTQIKMGGLERVFAGGTSENTTIDLLGREKSTPAALPTTRRSIMEHVR